MAIFTGKHLCWSLFNNVQALLHRLFLVNIAKFLTTPILKNIFEDVGGV